MKKFTFAFLAVAFIIGSAFTILIDWKADDKASKITWTYGTHFGTFGNLAATINFDKDKLAESKITASIDVISLKTDNEGLTNHLLAADYFNAFKFPKITFTSQEITSKDGAYVAKGILAMKDSVKNIEFPFVFKEEDATKAIFDGTMTVSAADYGLVKKDAKGNDVVKIVLVVPVTK